jgi:hypothetical protein
VLFTNKFKKAAVGIVPIKIKFEMFQEAQKL